VPGGAWTHAITAATLAIAIVLFILGLRLLWFAGGH
jgi:hypothetical protein